MKPEAVREIGWPALRRHRRFRAAVERNAARIVAQKMTFRPVLRWLSNGLGRSAVLARALMWDARDGGVTIADILESTRARGTASDGRVLQIFRRAEAAGLVVTSADAGPWTSRRLIFRPEYVEAIRERVVIEIEAASLVLPRVARAAALMADDLHLRAFLARLSRFHMVPPESLGPRNPSIRRFLVHEAGLTMLYDLIAQQSPERTRMLESAPFSRLALSRRHGVSRRHVARLFDEAAAAGDLWFPTRNRIQFSERMDEEAGRHFALTFHTIATSTTLAMEDVSAGRAIDIAG